MSKEMIRLANGQVIQVEVNGVSPNGQRGHAFLLAQNREIDVVKIDGAWHEDTTNEFEAMYGPSYPHAKYQIGERICFPDSSSPSGINSGRILHVIPPAEGRSCAYVVTPAITGFPTEIYANEIIEP